MISSRSCSTAASFEMTVVAPAAVIACRVSSFAYTDKPTTTTCGYTRLMSMVALMPSSLGMLISITTTDGLRTWTASNASSPLQASPTTSKFG
jgi:hypothetical protein